MQASATLDLTGKELGNDVCFDTCKEYTNCGGVYIKVRSFIYFPSPFISNVFLYILLVAITQSKLAIDFSNVQDKTCHLVDKSVVERQNSLVADLGTTSYTLLPLRYLLQIVKIKEDKHEIFTDSKMTNMEFFLKQRLGHLGQSSCAILFIIPVVDSGSNYNNNYEYNYNYDGIRCRSSTHRIQIQYR